MGADEPWFGGEIGANGAMTIQGHLVQSAAIRRWIPNCH
jgi:hypothetical protein